MSVALTNDGRFDDSESRNHAYALWLAQTRSENEDGLVRQDLGGGVSCYVRKGGPLDTGPGWVEASAAGCIAEAMAVLTRPDAAYKVCAGYMGVLGHSMYYFEHQTAGLCPVRPVDADGFATRRSDAARVRRLVETKFFDQWHEGGGIAGSKFWSIPFLEPVPA